jgi:hypothetical protein
MSQLCGVDDRFVDLGDCFQAFFLLRAAGAPFAQAD